MPFYQNGTLALHKTSDMDDNAIVISDEDYAKIMAKMDEGGSFSIADDGTVTLVDPSPPDQAAIDQATAESVVMQHMVKAKVAELTWKPTVQYHTGDVVYHKGKMYVATSNNTANEPDSVPGDWKETD